MNDKLSCPKISLLKMKLIKTPSAIRYPLSAIVRYPLSAIRYRSLSAIRYSLLFVIFHACTAPEKLGNLDLVKWRADRGACKNERTSQIEAFKSVESELLGKHIDSITEILGRPDIHQLASRDQKYYVYFLEKGVHCQDITKKSVARKVLLRFNAIGLLAEMTFQTEPL